jgi:pyruvate dehydrogenase E1 component alpha subunit
MKLGIMGMNGIVGGGWQLAAGAALAARINKTDQVAVCFAGEGAANSRYFFNSLRNAVTYGWSYIALIENNFFNAGTPGARTSGVKYQAELAKGLGIPCVTVDGTDVAAVWAATKEAVDFSRKNKLPAVVEAVAMRWYDHSGFAGSKVGVDGAFGLPYRSDEEVKQWMSRDPIVKMKNWLVEQKIATADELAKIDAAEKAACVKAWEDAKKGTQVKARDGLKNVWMNRDVEATQWFDRKGPVANTYTVPEYLVKLHKNMPFEA